MERSFVFGILTPVFVFQDIPKGADPDGAFLASAYFTTSTGGDQPRVCKRS